MKKKKKEKILIVLSTEDSVTLEKTIKCGTAPARTLTRARILLLSHKAKSNKEITDTLSCSHDMVSLVRRRYREGGLAEALYDAPRPGQPKKITAAHEAFVIATACTKAPEGHDHWTLPELKKKLLARYKKLRSVSDERIRQILLHATLKPWREKNVVHPESHPALSTAHG